MREKKKHIQLNPSSRDVNRKIIEIYMNTIEESISVITTKKMTVIEKERLKRVITKINMLIS